jgi:hypothetical protein
VRRTQDWIGKLLREVLHVGADDFDFRSQASRFVGLTSIGQILGVLIAAPDALLHCCLGFLQAGSAKLPDSILTRDTRLQQRDERRAVVSGPSFYCHELNAA